MKLVHASISETGGSGWDGKAKAGDQTSKEVCVRSWYSKPWDFALRYPDDEIRLKASAAAVKLANSNLVGYDQSERNTLYKALKSCNWDVDAYIKSRKKTETDCSAFVYAVYCCFVPSMRSDSNAPVTSTMRNKYRDWGFSVITKENANLSSGFGLTNGDIVVKENSHTAMVTDTSKKATLNSTTLKYSFTSSKEIDNALTTIALDVINGKWGNGNDRKEKLYAAIQSRVNDLLKRQVKPRIVSR